ncbi:undecaprenyl-diphosphate phosphatase [Hufsiella ginkgonis]|uniref:Undecaprenyl-diphosphatase n=1 Tax=Hufsiella ginkgonis TaxID=2695274 RepID=A0A7K1Y1M0_9SPHI|nr:undecaprenyl-diphosphate phosphatase [Hufsiella ginkgonis]MXV17150.1 undecaprenyl-diphosphate phosphatase [Hufsiella ginkgonis]
MTTAQAIVLAVIEGLTEFLPVSSTGHMILGSALMGIGSEEFVKLYIVAIQLGAILSVVVLYFQRFFQSFQFYFKLLVAFVPAVVLGVLLSDKIDQLLENAMGVAIALLVGGVILLFTDKWFKNSGTGSTDEVTYLQALKIGLFQCLAMIPGTSRSAASIVGGMTQGLTRKAAAEFSFFLAVPTMFGATAKKLYDFYKDGYPLTGEEIKLLAIGNVVAFLVAILAIRSFITFLQKKGFVAFGWYRIVVGVIILAILLSGRSLQVI